MTPRRDRPLKRCTAPECPHVGRWDGDRCPLHTDPKPDTANPGGRHMTPTPALTKCAERSCPARGRWAEGAFCAWHADYPVPRPATDSEKRGHQADPTGADTDQLQPHQRSLLRSIADPKQATP